MINAGANLEVVDGDGKTALLTAVLNRKHTCLEQLLAAGADPNHWSAPDRMGPPLLVAIGRSSPSMVELLLDAKADPFAAEADGATPLSTARARCLDLIRDTIGISHFVCCVDAAVDCSLAVHTAPLAPPPHLNVRRQVVCPHGWPVVARKPGAALRLTTFDA